MNYRIEGYRKNDPQNRPDMTQKEIDKRVRDCKEKILSEDETILEAFTDVLYTFSRQSNRELANAIEDEDGLRLGNLLIQPLIDTINDWAEIREERERP